jgi:Tfp pilus assembly protein PilN
VKPHNFVSSQIYQRARAVYRWLGISITLLLCACFAIVCIQLRQMHHYIDIKNKLHIVNKQIDAQQALVRKQIDLENQLKLITESCQTIRKKSSTLYSAITSVAESLPYSVRLNQLSYTTKKIELRGCARTLTQLTKFIQKVSKQVAFSEVKLMRAKKTATNNELEFEMLLFFTAC